MNHFYGHRSVVKSCKFSLICLVTNSRKIQGLTGIGIQGDNTQVLHSKQAGRNYNPAVLV